jgi:hypothetical protein
MPSLFLAVISALLAISLSRAQPLLNAKPPPQTTVIVPNAANAREAILPIGSDNPDITPDKIEASGIVWLPEENQYLLASDEQYDDAPGLFVLRGDTQLLSQLSIPGDVNVDDFESISINGQTVYALSSLAHNKHGELKAKRKKLLRFNYHDNHATDPQTIDLFALLTAIKNDQPQSDLARFLDKGLREHSLDIEAHFIKDNDLYLGFKSPLAHDNATVIIKLNNLDALFKGQQPSATLWKTLRLTESASTAPSPLSDLLLLNDTLYLLSVSSSATKNSYLWRYSLQENQLQLIKSFAGLNAEGITYRADRAQFMVVFDEGKNYPSRYQFLSLPASGQKR